MKRRFGWRSRPRAGSAGRPLGYLEGIAGGRLVGWACDPAASRSRLAVSLVGDSGTVVQTCADCYRADLHLAGFGDGHAGFSVAARRFRDGESVRAFAGAGPVELRGGPIVAAGGAGARAGRALGPLLVHVDPARASASRVTGWVFDSRDPLRRCVVALRCRRRPIAQVRATLFRDDLPDGAGDSLHGFAFDLGFLEAASMGGLELSEVETGGVLARLPLRR